MSQDHYSKLLAGNVCIEVITIGGDFSFWGIDFSKKEIEAAIGKGFEPVNLGPSRLRTETAAVVACHTINIANES